MSEPVQNAFVTSPNDPIDGNDPASDLADPRPATTHTAALHHESVDRLAIDALDDADEERSTRGLLATHPTGRIENDYGIAWDTSRYDFLRNDHPAPDTVHPSLWRQAKLNAPHGLFEVAEGLWQVRGYDISNVTFLQGKDGWVVIDPLTVTSTAAAALELANRTLGARPVTAVIYTHSHADHFGGIYGVTSPEAVAAGDVRIIAPEGFLQEAVSENIIAGPAMARRTAYQFGALLPPGPRGHVDCGLGKAVPLGTIGLLAPTEEISRTGQELTVDGIRNVYQNTPESEAPAEMNFFFPEQGWLCMAENCSHNMHNLVPIRGAQVRDALSWSKYIDEAMSMFGEQTEIMFASHHWPRWGRDDANVFMGLQRDLYRWIHDQTMRLANHGFTPLEIAEQLQLPPEFQTEAHTRGYYGSLVHNVKAVYQRYLSWYDGNPAHLWPHPPEAVGRRYVDLAGGIDQLVAKAQTAFDDGDYRWVAEIVNHAVFAEPTHTGARALQAAALEQLGYQSESATFRNAYLNGARELREGPPPSRVVRRRQFIDALTVEQIFDTLAVRLNADQVAGLRVVTNWHFSDVDEHWVLELGNRVLIAHPETTNPASTVSVVLAKPVFTAIMSGESTLAEAVEAGDIVVDGAAADLLVIFGNLDTFESGFAIVEP